MHEELEGTSDHDEKVNRASVYMETIPMLITVIYLGIEREKYKISRRNI